jgi:hypothetical protein
MQVQSFRALYGVKRLRYKYGMVCCQLSTIVLCSWCVHVWLSILCGVKESISVRCVEEVVILSRSKLFWTAKSKGVLFDLFRGICSCFFRSRVWCLGLRRSGVLWS